MQGITIATQIIVESTQPFSEYHIVEFNEKIMHNQLYVIITHYIIKVCKGYKGTAFSHNEVKILYLGQQST